MESDIPFYAPYALGLWFLFIGYLIGSIPFGLILTRLGGYGDIRKIGSGNIGATNVLRTGSKVLALATLILCTPFALLTNTTESGPAMFSIYPILVGLGAIIGHCFPVWLKFKGGKGVATTLGTLLAAVPFAGLIACGVWLLSAFVFRISSLSALIAIAVTPLAAWYFYGLMPAVVALLIAVLVFARHKDNIKRIHNGTEPRIGDKKKNNEKPVSDQTGS